MSCLYEIVGISRQAHYKQAEHLKKKQIMESTSVDQVLQVRKAHPRMGLRKIYHMLQPEGIGRDHFEQIMIDRGLGIRPQRNFRKTTYPHPSLRYPSLIEGLDITAINQLWVSDITYFYTGKEFYYICFITDVYSRRVVGYAASHHLKASLNMQALKMAFESQKGKDLFGLIHHSDRGTQYCSKQYTTMLRSKGIQISMGNKAWENAHAERINGIIKNEYLFNFKPEDVINLQKELKTVVELYNKQRPHWSLPNRLSPEKFEKLSSLYENEYIVKINY